MERAFWRVAVRGVAAFVRWGGYENAHRGCTCIFAQSQKKAPGAGSGSVGFARYLVLWNVVAAPHANLNAFKLEHVGLIQL